MDVVFLWLVTLKGFHGLLKFPLDSHLNFCIHSILTAHMEKFLLRCRAIHAKEFMPLTNCENMK